MVVIDRFSSAERAAQVSAGCHVTHFEALPELLPQAAAKLTDRILSANERCFARLHLLKTSTNFRVPRGFDVAVRIEAVDESFGKPRAVLDREVQGLSLDLSSGSRHRSTR
jgi:hypothetical protein